MAKVTKASEVLAQLQEAEWRGYGGARDNKPGNYWAEKSAARAAKAQGSLPPWLTPPPGCAWWSVYVHDDEERMDYNFIVLARTKMAAARAAKSSPDYEAGRVQDVDRMAPDAILGDILDNDESEPEGWPHKEGDVYLYDSGT